MGVPASDTRFLRKVYLILVKEDPAIVSWDAAGRSFSIFNTALFQKLIKSKYHLSSLCTFRQNLQAHGFIEIEQPLAAGPKNEDGAMAPETYYHEYFVKGHPEYLEKIPFDPSLKFRCQECKRQPNETGTKCSFRRAIATAPCLPPSVVEDAPAASAAASSGAGLEQQTTVFRVNNDSLGLQGAATGRIGQQPSLMVRIGGGSGFKSTPSPAAGSLTVRLPFVRSKETSEMQATKEQQASLASKFRPAVDNAAARETFSSPPQSSYPKNYNPVPLAPKTSTGVIMIKPNVAPQNAQNAVGLNAASHEVQRLSSPKPGNLQVRIVVPPMQTLRKNQPSLPVQILNPKTRPSASSSVGKRVTSVSVSLTSPESSVQQERQRRHVPQLPMPQAQRLDPNSQIHESTHLQYPFGVAPTSMLKPLKPKQAIGTGFVHTLWNILTSEDPSVVSWNNGGTSFSIHDTEKFEQATLLKHQLPNLCTFRHFLRAHGFKEVTGNQPRDGEGAKGAETYRQDDFVAGHLDRLDRITFDDSAKLILCQECKLKEQGSRCSARRHTVNEKSQSSTTTWNQSSQVQASRQPSLLSSDMQVGQTSETLQTASAPQNSFITSRARTTHVVQYPPAISTDQFSGNYSSTTSDRPHQRRIDPFPSHLLQEQPPASTSREHPVREFSRTGSERTMERSWSTHTSTVASSSSSSLIAGIPRNQTSSSTTQPTPLSTRLATKTITGLAVLPFLQAPMSVTLTIGSRKRGKQSSGVFGFEKQSVQQKRMRLSPQSRTADRDVSNPLLPEWNGSGEQNNQTSRTPAATERTVDAPPTQHLPFADKLVAGWTHAGHSSDGHHHLVAPQQSNTYPQPIPRLPSMSSQRSSYTTVPIHASSGRAGSNDDLAGNRKSKASSGASSPRGVYAPSSSPGNGKSLSTESEEDGLSLLMLASAPRLELAATPSILLLSGHAIRSPSINSMVVTASDTRLLRKVYLILVKKRPSDRELGRGQALALAEADHEQVPSQQSVHISAEPADARHH